MILTCSITEQYIGEICTVTTILYENKFKFYVWQIHFLLVTFDEMQHSLEIESALYSYICSNVL